MIDLAPGREASPAPAPPPPAVPCTVCGAVDHRTLYRPHTSPGPVVRCRRCGMVYVSPRQDQRALIHDGADVVHDQRLRRSADLRDLAGCWESAALATTLAQRDARALNHQAALAAIARHRPPPGTLLDFGCGWGFFLESARQAGWDVRGIEPLPGHGVFARGALGLDVVTDTLRPDTFPPASFDVATAFQVFEHLPDPAAEIDKLHAVLKPGGLVAIEVPNIDTVLVSLLRGRHRHFVQDHLWFFGPATLARFLQAHGFDILETTFPTRRLTVRHVIDHWTARQASPRVADALHRGADRAGALDRVIRVNLRDIVMVIARKAA